MSEKNDVAFITPSRKHVCVRGLQQGGENFGEFIGADPRGSYLCLKRRLFIILVLTALVIAGITVLLVKLVSSGDKKTSATAEIDPVSSPE